MKKLLFLLLPLLFLAACSSQEDEFVYTDYTLRARQHLETIERRREEIYEGGITPFRYLPHFSDVQSLEIEVYLGNGRTGRRNATFVHPTRLGNYHFMIPLTERNQSFFNDLGFEVQISVDGRNARLTRGHTFLDFSDQSSTIFRNYIAVAQLVDSPVYVNSTLYIPAEMFFKAIDVRTSFEDGVLVAHLHDQPLVEEDIW